MPSRCLMWRWPVKAGENEMAEGKLTLKNMQTGDQQLVTIDELIKIVNS